MASLTKSWKTQTLNLFGPAGTTKWLAFNWGTGTWGAKSAGTGGSPGLTWNFNKVWGANSPLRISCPTSAIIPHRIIRLTWAGSNKITPLYANAKKYRTDQAGYYYQSPGPTNNIESAAAYPSYSAASHSVSGFVTYTHATTSWVTSVTY